MMEVIINKNTNLKKEKLIIKSLEQSIKNDLKKNDLKSLKYHSMSLKEHKKVLDELRNKNVDYEMERL